MPASGKLNGEGAGQGARQGPQPGPLQGALGRRGPGEGRCSCFPAHCPGCPRAEERRLSREVADEPGTRTRTPPALQLPPCLLPQPSPCSSPHPHPRGGGTLLTPAACAYRSKRSDLTVSGAPDRECYPLPPQSRGAVQPQVAQSLRLFS